MNKRAEFLKTTDEQSDRINRIRLAFSDLYDAIDEECKPSR